MTTLLSSMDAVDTCPSVGTSLKRVMPLEAQDVNRTTRMQAAARMGTHDTARALHVTMGDLPYVIGKPADPLLQVPA